ncbi:MAG: 5,6-dimethylbenzimidazole synthase [Gammaproteobacteria bacterium]|nr:5,6-dimethylbenzimidazole synthase [Gammaproteobacteria bacterium]MCF6229556.1 5,6-dimethylbenzimidazole synthase [Gammaproteobacteria bacterium]
MNSPHRYNQTERNAIDKVIRERRDMRHFNHNPVDTQQLIHILDAAHHAPSVGLMQPWRFLRITKSALRQQIQQLVEEERQQTAEAIGERQQAFLRLKVEGIMDAAELLVVSLMPEREQHIFGRRTLPEMDLASVACAIQNMWLTARAEGLGLGWVSLFEPHALAELLQIPEGAKPIAILCIGHVDAFYERPMLEQLNWRQAEPLQQHLFENSWGNPSPLLNKCNKEANLPPC